MQSPYGDIDVGQWQRRTEELVAAYPLVRELARVAVKAWNDIFASGVNMVKCVIIRTKLLALRDS